MDEYGTILAASGWSQVAVDGVAIGALLAAVFVVMRGARLLLGMIRGGSEGGTSSTSEGVFGPDGSFKAFKDYED